MNHEFCVYTLMKFKTVNDDRLCQLPSVNQHLKTFMEAYKRVHPEKNKNVTQTIIGKEWKKRKEDFPAAD